MISLVLPAHNEAGYIEKAVERSRDILEGLGEDFEVLIAEDGSTDRTDVVASNLDSRFGDVRHIHYTKRLGRGEALRKAFNESRGDFLFYMDVDLATDPVHLIEALDLLRDGVDVVTGSRYLPGSSVSRDFKRRFFSKGFNFLVRKLVGSGLRDHQCGFKGFRREALFQVLPEVEDEHWFWDTEFLVRAQRKGLRVEEFPVDWEEKGDSKVDFWRDIVGMGLALGRLWWDTRIPSFSRKTKAIIFFVFSLVLIGLLIGLVGSKNFLEAVSGVNRGVLGLAVVVYFLSWPVRGVRYRFILKGMGQLRGLFFLTGSIAVSQASNVLLPARIGDLVRAYILKERGDVSYGTGLSSLTVERVFDLLAVLSLGVVSVFLAGYRGWGVRVIVAGVVVLAVFFVFLLRFPSRVIGRLLSGDPYREKVGEWLKGFYEEIVKVSVSPSSFFVVSVSSFSVWVLDIFTAFVVLRSLGVSPPLPLVFLAIVLGNLAKIVPVTPGGIGTYEAAVTAVLGVGGVPAPVALSAAVVDHALKNGVTLLLGGIYLPVLSVKITELFNLEPYRS